MSSETTALCQHAVEPPAAEVLEPGRRKLAIVGGGRDEYVAAIARGKAAKAIPLGLVEVAVGRQLAHEAREHRLERFATRTGERLPGQPDVHA